MSSLLNVSSLNGAVTIHVKEVEGFVSHLEKVITAQTHLLSKDLLRENNICKK